MEKSKVAVIAAVLSLVAGSFATDGAREAFLKQQAFAEMQRVSGEVDVLRQNFTELESRLRSVSSKASETADLRQEIDALKDSIRQLRAELDAQRSRIVAELASEIKKMSRGTQRSGGASAPARTETYKGKTGEYVVVQGDTLSLIARALNTNVSLIKRLNGLKSDNLRIGQKLIVPVEE